MAVGVGPTGSRQRRRPPAPKGTRPFAAKAAGTPAPESLAEGAVWEITAGAEGCQPRPTTVSPDWWAVQAVALEPTVGSSVSQLTRG